MEVTMASKKKRAKSTPTTEARQAPDPATVARTIADAIAPLPTLSLAICYAIDGYGEEQRQVAACMLKGVAAELSRLTDPADEAELALHHVPKPDDDGRGWLYATSCDLHTLKDVLDFLAIDLAGDRRWLDVMANLHVCHLAVEHVRESTTVFLENFNKALGLAQSEPVPAATAS